MSEQNNSMMNGVTMTATMLLFAGLVILAALRWSRIEWGAVVWFAAFVATILIRSPYAAKNRSNAVTTAHKGADEKVLITAMFFTAGILPLLQLGTGVFDFAGYRLDDRITAIGAVLQIPYLVVFWRSHADLGRNWSPGLEVRESHELVTNGIYARIRHPMYAAIWISALAQPLLVHNWIAGFLVVPAFVAMWFIRVPQEEAMMRQTFGDAYDAYCMRTGRLFPRGKE